MKNVLTVKAKINLTENVEKVEKAVKNVFPTVSTQNILGIKGDTLIAEASAKDALAMFYKRLREQRILGAARRILRQSECRGTFTFYLNKQAAYVNRISFCEPMGESSLGPIDVSIVSEDPKELIDWLAPMKVMVEKSKS